MLCHTSFWILVENLIAYPNYSSFSWKISRPKPNSKKYAYYEQAGTRDRQATIDDDDFDADFSDGEDE